MTSAAVIMVAVFSIFAALSLIEFKMFGVAMATAVLTDAIIVRGVLLQPIARRRSPDPGSALPRA